MNRRPVNQIEGADEQQKEEVILTDHDALLSLSPQSAWPQKLAGDVLWVPFVSDETHKQRQTETHDFMARSQLDKHLRDLVGIGPAQGRHDRCDLGHCATARSLPLN